MHDAPPPAPLRRALRITAIAGLALTVGATAGARQPAQDLRDQPQRPALAEQPQVVDGEGEARTIDFGRFSEPVELASLVDFIGRTLDVNIILSEADLAGRAVEFKAPVQVREDELLPLLQTLLAQQGFGMTRTDQGWLMIAPAASLPVTLEGDLATTRVFPTPLVKPSALQNAITTMLGGEGTNRRIAYLDELGVIISTAPPRLNDSLGRVIERLLAEQAGIRLRRFDLTHVAAEEARQRLLELVGQAQSRSGGAAQPAGAQGGQPGGGGSALVGQALANLADRLIVDRQSNALIFRGSEAEAEELSTLMAVVDAPSRLIIRRYNAGQMSPVIASYGERLGLGPVATGAGAGASGAQAARGSTFVGSGFVIESGDEENAGAFTYYGTPEQHERVESLVSEFAEQVRNQQMVVEFYRLENASAEEAAGLINELLALDTGDQVGSSPFVTRSLERSPITRVDNIGGSGAAADATGGASALPGTQGGVTGAPGGDESGTGLTPAEGVAIIADIPRNQLIVKAPVRQQREIEQIIRKIDLRRGQVYIEAQIVSVSSSDDFSITVETVLTDPDSDTPIFTNFGLLDDPKNTGGVRMPFGDGLSAALINNDYVPLIIQALKTEGAGRVMSQPRLLVNDNEEAEISSTRNEPFAQTTQTVGTPSQTGLGGTLSAGTTLSVRPQISEGGFVKLEFAAELSAFGERPNPDLPPATTSDNLTSAVTVPADNTVVLGGFTQQTETDSVSKIPILGDIPLLGWIFRSTSKQTSYRTIYIFITPRVLRDPSFADLRLLTKGPSELMEIELVADLPALEPAVMPILGQSAADDDDAETAVSSASGGDAP
jgi:type II secretory pathway component GspD/PulD (secretin)